MDLSYEMIGAPVVARDGKDLGKLKEIQGDAMHIDAPMAFDYWLPVEVIQSAEPDHIVLRLAADDISDYKLDPPEENQREDVRSVVSGIGGDALPSEDTMGSTVGWADVSPRFREQWLVQHEKTGTWEEYEPGFHFGYEMASDPRFMGRTWEDSEIELRSEYKTWPGASRSSSDDSSWDRLKGCAREAWTSKRAA